MRQSHSIPIARNGLERPSTIGDALLHESRKQTIAADQMAEGTNNLNFNLELLRTEISSHSRWLAWIFWSNIAIIVIAMLLLIFSYFGRH
jgi:hypothetical protein